MTEQAYPIAPARREVLRAFAEVLTPGGGDFPTAAAADPDESVLELAMYHLRGQMPEIERTIDAAQGRDPAGFLDGLAQEDPERFEQVRALLVCRYLTCRPVWRLLGYSGQRPWPPAPGEAEEYLSGGILEPVVRRGPIYTPTPGVRTAEPSRG